MFIATAGKKLTEEIAVDNPTGQAHELLFELVAQTDADMTQAYLDKVADGLGIAKGHSAYVAAKARIDAEAARRTQAEKDAGQPAEEAAAQGDNSDSGSGGSANGGSGTGSGNHQNGGNSGGGGGNSGGNNDNSGGNSGNSGNSGGSDNGGGTGGNGDNGGGNGGNSGGGNTTPPPSDNPYGEPGAGSGTNYPPGEGPKVDWLMPDLPTNV